MSMWDDEAGYDRDDPKHPGFAERAYEKADLDRKRAKEDGLMGCGHPLAAVVTSGEGTSHCPLCEKEARRGS